MTFWTPLSIFVLAFLVSWRLTPRIRQAYLAAGWVDAPGKRKIQEQPVPYGAGFSVLLGFAAPVLIGLGAAWVAWENAPEILATHSEGIRSKAAMMIAILAGSSCMLIMGRLDDRYDLSAKKRFAIQIVAASLVVLAGVRITLFIASVELQIITTILWLVFITNATNFIDNMDGLLAGSALNSSLVLGVIAALGGQWFVAAFALALAGAIAGVLPFNRSPARIYLGDEGSMFIGFLLGCLATLLTYVQEGPATTFNFRPFLLPLLCLALPIVDGSFVIVTRLMRGDRPWTPGRDHLSHRLVRSGRSSKSAVSILVASSLVCSGLAVLIQEQSIAGILFATFFLMAAIGVGLRGARS